jgi:hypothetical protein
MMGGDGIVRTNGVVATRKDYAFTGQNVAMSECNSQGCNSGLEYFQSDALDSVAAVTNASGGGWLTWFKESACLSSSANSRRS